MNILKSELIPVGAETTLNTNDELNIGFELKNATSKIVQKFMLTALLAPRK